MRRPWIWIVGGKWDRVAALTRLFTALALLLLYVGYNEATGRADRNARHVAVLAERIGRSDARVAQLKEALRVGRIPIPPPPTTTTSAPTRRPPKRSEHHTPTTRRPKPPSPAPRPSPTTTTTPPCPTVPAAGVCRPAPTVP